MASDHHLVTARLKLKLRRNWIPAYVTQHRYNTAFLRDSSKLEEFRITLSNKYQVLQELLEEDKGTLESKWKEIKEAVTNLSGSVWPQEVPAQRVDLRG